MSLSDTHGRTSTLQSCQCRGGTGLAHLKAGVKPLHSLVPPRNVSWGVGHPVIYIMSAWGGAPETSGKSWSQMDIT